MHKKTIYELLFKRPLDFILSLIAIIILSPIFLLVAILIRIKLGSPIIFKQTRPGRYNKPFKMFKFRTMTDQKDENGNLLPDEIRLTKFGKFLRSTSLDELPELINIFFGEMSLVGPRPQLIKDLLFMDENIRNRHDVRPGLTGLAQVNGRNVIDWGKKFEYDLKYIQKITFTGDLIILMKTILKVFLRKDISQINHATSIDYGDYLLENGIITSSEYKDTIERNKGI